MIINYYLQVETNLGLLSTILEFNSEVSRILNDNNGWKKYGYQFNQTLDINKAELKIYLNSSKLTTQLCGTNLKNLSCTRFIKKQPIDIIINYNNWIGNSKSKLNIQDYHTYVINHEVGHFLGLNHNTCPIKECKKRNMKICPASIMQQMSKGPKHISPCIESIYPLNPDWRIDNPKLISGGGIKNKIIYLYIILVILIILVIFIIFNTNIHYTNIHYTKLY